MATSILQGLGQLGADTGTAALELADQRRKDAAQRMEQARLGLSIKELQQRIAEADPVAKKAMVEKALGRPMTNDELQRYFGIQPPTKLSAQTLLGPDGKPHRYLVDETTGVKTDLGQAEWSWSQKLTKGDVVPDKNSITGYSRVMTDAQGNVAKTIPNVIIPGLTPKEMKGYAITTDADGNVIAVPETKVTTPIVPGASGVATPSSGTPSSVSSAPKASSPSQSIGGGRIIGQKETAVQKDAVKAAGDARQASTLVKDVDANAEAAKRGNPRASLALVFSAVRVMVQGAGRMTQVELQQEASAGNLPQLFQRWYSMAVNGTLPPEQIDQITEMVRNGAEAKRQDAASAWQFAYPSRPLPPWLEPPKDNKTIPPPPSGAVLVGR